MPSSTSASLWSITSKVEHMIMPRRLTRSARIKPTCIKIVAIVFILFTSWVRLARPTTCVHAITASKGADVRDTRPCEHALMCASVHPHTQTYTHVCPRHFKHTQAHGSNWKTYGGFRQNETGMDDAHISRKSFKRNQMGKLGWKCRNVWVRLQ